MIQCNEGYLSVGEVHANAMMGRLDLRLYPIPAITPQPPVQFNGCVITAP
jgi:hypothetical protein